MTIQTDFDLFVAPDKIYLKPIHSSSELIVIDRLSYEITLQGQSDDNQVPPRHILAKKVYGIIGIINLISGPHLIVITSCSKVGDIFGSHIWKVEDTEMIPYSRTTLHLTEEQIQFNNEYVSMIKSVLTIENYYFSSNYDLTHSLQRIYNAGPDFITKTLFDRADDRFVWNKYLLSDFSSRNELKKFCLPIIQGFVSIKSIVVNQAKVTWILVSRRNIKRAGTRLFMRGSDTNGNVANYVETEQMLEYSGQRCSFVQIRGSIPIFWSQFPCLKYKPHPTPITGLNHVDVLKKHINSITSIYGPVVLINLINHTGPEKVMEAEFAKSVSTINDPNVRFESFDFHHECRNMRWDKLSLLMDKINQEIDDYAYFHLLADGSTIQSQQVGIFRTNCIDSLDRTNVVQGLIAKKCLEIQLSRLGIFGPGEKIDDHYDFSYIYRNVWADNADMISVEYSGTGALKTDFTRTGKRTRLGVLRDGYNSLMRYYKNNFTDGFRQDAMDLFLGNYKVDPNEGNSLPCPLDRKKDWKYLALPLIFLGSIAMFFFSLFIPAEHSTETFIYLFFWFGMIAMSLSVIIFYGSEFVDLPKLTDVKSIQRHGHESRKYQNKLE